MFKRISELHWWSTYSSNFEYLDGFLKDIYNSGREIKIAKTYLNIIIVFSIGEEIYFFRIDDGVAYNKIVYKLKYVYSIELGIIEDVQIGEVTFGFYRNEIMYVIFDKSKFTEIVYYENVELFNDLDDYITISNNINLIDL